MKDLYHGSPKGNIKILKPTSPGKKQPKAVYATKRKGLATAFSIKRLGWNNIKRRKDKWAVADVSDKQLDETGYIYHLKPREFEQYQGWQYINEKPTKPKRVEEVDIGEELKRLGWQRTQNNKVIPMTTKDSKITRGRGLRITPKTPRLRR